MSRGWRWEQPLQLFSLSCGWERNCLLICRFKSSVIWHCVNWQIARRVLVGKPEEMRPFERPRRRLEDHIKMNLTEVGCKEIEWRSLAQDRQQLVDCCEHSDGPVGSIKCYKFLDWTVRFPQRTVFCEVYLFIYSFIHSIE